MARVLIVLLVGRLQRSILLQTEATDSKNRVLSEFLSQAAEETNRILQERSKYRKFTDFWHAMSPGLKSNTGFNIQVICDIFRATWRKQKGCTAVEMMTIKFNVPRNCKTFDTKGFHFVELGLYPKKRLAIPIKKNRDWDRFAGLLGSGWTCKTYGLTPSLEIVAYLSKEDKELIPRRNILGIDVNAKHLAVSVVSYEGRILYQTYFGKHIWVRRKHLMERRGVLQTVGAKRKLARLKTKEADFVNTNLGQVVREVMNLAKRFDADITIEKLKRFSPKGRNFNRTVMRIPFYRLRMLLEDRCFDNGITLNIVNPWHTSKWCIRCGAVGDGHSANYSLFRCLKCGLTMNADRKASVAIAIKSLLERRQSPNQNFFQISSRRVLVSGLVKASEEVPGHGGAVLAAGSEESPQL